MATRHNLYTLSNTTATLVSPAGVHSGVDITIQNLGTGKCYIGGEGVTTSSYGFAIASESAFSVELDGQDHIYAISENDGDEIAVLMFGLEK